MKKTLYIFAIMILISGCFNPPDVTPPMFVPKSPPDSLVETGIDAHPDNAIYLEWEEPSSATEEGILSYYIYRGTYVDGEYKFKYHDEVVRNSGVIYESNSYVDYDATLDSTYYYYLRSHNDFADSRTTSDTVYYKLVNKCRIESPAGDISQTQPNFSFSYPKFQIDRINYFYCRVEEYQERSYETVYFVKIFRHDLSKTRFNFYLNNNSSHTTILLNLLDKNEQDDYYLNPGNYRWRVDAISGQLGGAPETEGSESEWMYFTVN